MSGERVTPKLTEVESKARSASIQSGLHYKIFVDFREGEAYSGLVRIEFRLNSSENVFLDFCGDSIQSILLNGTEEDVSVLYDVPKGRISLPSESLKTGQLNIIHIKYSNRYYTDGNGIQTYADVDGSQYLYTQSEAYWGNRVMPLFDQPDLKASYKLHAVAPES